MENERIEKFNIWGRELDLKIVFDNFEGEEITKQQIQAYESFIKQHNNIFEQAYIEIEKYCKENYNEQINNNFDNIFKYVKPTTIYIKRSSSNDRIIAILCNFKFDIEHGIAVLVTNETDIKVCMQDDIL
ncbi:MAG: hypothetical protein E7311_05430 [Clostridiales bacterium]|nr:hypothetical protein [Clostridiales bacterium]